MTQPKQIFISSAGTDRNVAESLALNLNSLGFQVVVDQEASNPGDDWATVIDQSLMTSKAYLFLISPEALTSQWIGYEMGVALARAKQNPEVKILPVVLPGTSISTVPQSFLQHQALDFNAIPETERTTKIQQALESAVA